LFRGTIMIIDASEIRYRALGETNTQTRRLAYLSAITRLIATMDISQEKLITKLLSWSQSTQDRLKDYWVSTGEITQTPKNSSIKRYVDLSLAIGLIAQVSSSFCLTRTGTVFYTLIRDIKQNINPFFLSDTEKIFYLHLLLSKDSDLLLTIADLIIKNPDIYLSNIQEQFQDEIITRLNTKLSLASDEITRQELLDRRNIIQHSWRSPKRYAEHIVPPRLNWLLDLDFLEPGSFKRHHFCFTEQGGRFFSGLPTVGKPGLHDVSGNWLDADFWSLAANTVLQSRLLKYSKDIDDQMYCDIFIPYLEDAFKAFRYTVVPKISLTEALLYISLAVLIQEGVVISPTSLSKWLETPRVFAHRQFEIRYSPRENERYVIMKSI